MFGVRDAIPILTVAQLIGNASRVWFNRHELELPVVGWFAVGGVPAARLDPSRPELSDLIVVASTEVNTDEDRAAYAKALREVLA